MEKLVETEPYGVLRQVGERDPAKRNYFITGVDLAAAAQRLSEERTKLFYEATPIPLTYPNGRVFTLKAGRGTTSDKTLVYLQEEGRDVASLTYQYEPTRRQIFIVNTFTEPAFRQQKAQQALAEVTVAMHPEATSVATHLGWTNFQKVAESLAGKPLGTVAEQEKTVAAAVAGGTTEAIAGAVLHSPRGKIMTSLGFELDTTALQFWPSAETHGDGPLIVTRWLRSAPSLPPE